MKGEIVLDDPRMAVVISIKDWFWPGTKLYKVAGRSFVYYPENDKYIEILNHGEEKFILKEDLLNIISEAYDEWRKKTA